MRSLYRKIWFILIVLCQQVLYAQDAILVNSPGEINQLMLKLEQGVLYYKIERHKEELLQWSSLGIQLKDQPAYGAMRVAKMTRKQVDHLWKPVWEKQELIRDHYNELLVLLRETAAPSRRLSVRFRIYDDGIAFRYELDGKRKDSMVIARDNTGFAIPSTATWWAHFGERDNLGPLPVDQLPDSLLTPFLARTTSGSFIAIQEAAIESMGYFKLKKRPGYSNVLSCNMPESKTILPAHTSWRTVMATGNERDIVMSNLLVNLNPPCSLKDVSWIKPGKATWIWRARGYKTKDGFEYEVNDESQKRFIDFAAENNFQYHVIDANWYGPEFDKTSDPTKADGTINIREVISYARQRGIGIFLYLNDVGAKKYGLETVLKQFHEWGAAGVKYGFMTGEGQEKVLHTRRVIELCAKYKLMLDFHDHPVPPSGDHRTWPHIVAREYGHAQADAKISTYPKETVNQVFINMLCGPLDMNNGWFDLNNAQKRTRVFEPVPGTLAGEMAKTLIIFTGLNCLPDAPEPYREKDSMFAFIRSMPPVFDEYRVLSGKIDEHISVARRKGDNWWIGSLTDEKPRELKITLDFLADSKTYRATLYEDGAAHYLDNKEAFHINTRLVKKGDVINARLGAGGGHCIFLEAIKDQ